ncbi:hypothetical protein ACFL3G_03010 [Planctomycetota bacterium]
MLYDFPPFSDDIIKQGDIFLNIPHVQFEFSDGLSVLGEDAIDNIPWKELVSKKEESDVAVVLGVTSVPAIVITQTCDAQRKEYITLCEIEELSSIGGFKSSPQTLKSEVRNLISQNKKKPDFFYLPSDKNIGFTDRMAVNFSNTIRLLREDLESLLENRKARLNEITYDYFREKLSDFFRRYAFNEWFMLKKDEVEHYKGYSDLRPKDFYDWQK